MYLKHSVQMHDLKCVHPSPVQEAGPLGEVLVAAPDALGLGPQLHCSRVGAHEQRPRQRRAVHACGARAACSAEGPCMVLQDG